MTLKEDFWDDPEAAQKLLKTKNELDAKVKSYEDLMGDFEDLEGLKNEDVLRTVSIFRFVNPEKQIRIAAGRFRFEDGGAALFRAGASATITGDMLTTVGNNTREDRAMFREMGFRLKPASGEEF